jgi:hypothetical protein
LILIVVVVIQLYPFGAMLLLPSLVEGAFVANVCFCVGPVAEGYLCCIGLDRKGVRAGLFILGVCFSIVLVFAFLTGVWWAGGMAG